MIRSGIERQGIDLLDGADFARARRWSLRVLSMRSLTPGLLRLCLVGDELGDFRHLPGQGLAFYLQQTGAEALWRHYAIRRFDPVAGTLDVDVVRHGDAPVASWAARLRLGDRIEVSGPRGRIVPARANWHLFSGDETALTAISAVVEALPGDAIAQVFLEVDGAADRLPVQGPARLQVQWLHRDGGRPGTLRLLVDAVAGFRFPGGYGHAYLLGEAGSVREQRRLLRERGLVPEQISAEAYWRPGRRGVRACG